MAQIASSVPTRVRFDKVDYNGGLNNNSKGMATSDQDILKFIENLGKQYRSNLFIIYEITSKDTGWSNNERFLEYL